jgi:hypothetical protein
MSPRGETGMYNGGEYFSISIHVYPSGENFLSVYIPMKEETFPSHPLMKEFSARGNRDQDHCHF